MTDRELDEFIKRSPDIHEIFHEGYRRGVIEGFTEAIKKTSEFMEMIVKMKNIRLGITNDRQRIVLSTVSVRCGW